MKKTLIASAIAATTFAGTALAQGQEEATPADLMAMMENMPTVYGNIQLVYSYTDVEGNGGGALSDNGSTIGVKHSAEIMPGVEAFGKIELEGINADNKDAEGDNAGLNELDEAYIGVRGDSFGEVWVGSDDSQYEALLGDYGNWIYEVAALNTYASYTTGEGDLVQYISPSIGGLTLHGAVQVRGSNDGQYAGGDNEYPYQLAAKYSVDALTVSLVMDSNDGFSDADGNGVNDSNENSYGLAVEFSLDALVLDAYYDHRAGVDGAGNGDFNLDGAEGRDQFGLMATYSLDANTFRLSYERAEADTDDLTTGVIMAQALHNLNDNMYVYVEGGLRDDENGGASQDTSQFNVGGVYYF